MSEHQIVAFRAVDGPVSEKNLEYMERQSSRAEITPWSFDNEYHYGDFHGNAQEMLRRGYDFYLHYANFGIRKLMIRLPNGLPDAKAAKPYFESEGLELVKDKQGPGAILCISPFYEPDDLDELWDIDDIVDRLLPLRAEIMEGDLRPLYLAHLAMACDGNHDPDEEMEAPVPAGLGKLTEAQSALAEFYGLDKSLIAAAACNSPPLPKQSDSRRTHVEWLKSQPETAKNDWLAQLIADPNSQVRRLILAEFQKSVPAIPWPTTPPSRTISELEAVAKEIEEKSNLKAAAKATQLRAKKLVKMAADPTAVLRETEKLIAQRGGDAYHQTATLLADLREALQGTPQSDLAQQQATKLKKANPTLKMLAGALRRQGFTSK